MQRVRVARIVDGLLRRGQGLAEHLAAEHVFGADVAALAAEQVVFEALQREQVDQFVDYGVGHSHGVGSGARIVRGAQAGSRGGAGPGSIDGNAASGATAPTDSTKAMAWSTLQSVAIRRSVGTISR